MTQPQVNISIYRQKLIDSFTNMICATHDDLFFKIVVAIDDLKEVEPMIFRMLLGQKFLAEIFAVIEDEYEYRTARPVQLV